MLYAKLIFPFFIKLLTKLFTKKSLYFGSAINFCFCNCNCIFYNNNRRFSLENRFFHFQVLPKIEKLKKDLATKTAELNAKKAEIRSFTDSEDKTIDEVKAGMAEIKEKEEGKERKGQES